MGIGWRQIGNSSKNGPNYEFEKQLESSKTCFSLDLDCLEKNIRKRETDSYVRLFQRNIPGQEYSTKFPLTLPKWWC